MYGPVPVPPRQRPPSGALVIVVRVVLVALTLLSFGMLAWVTMLRLAILRRRLLDWILFCVVLVLSVALLATVGSFAEQDWRTDAAMAALLIMAAGVVAHYLVADIRHFRLRTRTAASGGPYGPGQAPTGPVPPQPGFRSAFQPPPQQQYRPRQQTPPPPFSVPSPYSRAEPYPQGTPPGRARPQRIERVRAELDELSDYLRREDGNDR